MFLQVQVSRQYQVGQVNLPFHDHPAQMYVTLQGPDLLNNIIVIIFTPVLNSQGMKKYTICNTEKYKNQAGMNLTPPPPSQNSHAVRWHCTAESERRVAELKS